eukprot:CAMPEP_0201582458 /NCGR_PEP_ID=MMETSP0190_2-20130828/85495_1 /ASSEMBLY_ACC=CAM_ASM_000263 /TAXON_ID=37353 /ORGANISM="Rosalina sp." /LENGTH=259 /DNA_ID=CAMNT_0048022411 /DNA_START=8 /DNA_END=787 /DNA_ORIENTATION=+
MVTKVSSFIVFAILFITRAYSQCSWTVGGQTLDLSCVSGQTINSKDDTGHVFLYTVCSDGAGACDGGNQLMCKQTLPSDTSLCYEIGRWNAQESPTYDADTKTFEFQYNNGDVCQQQVRNFVPQFICDESINGLSAGDVYEPGFGGCSYYLPIRTKYACAGISCDADDASGGLSGGWVFIIILICGLFVYFVAGYVYMALTVNKEAGFGDFANNIPNRSLWCSLPSLVVAGCAVTKETIMGLMGKGGGEGDMGEPITAE